MIRKNFFFILLMILGGISALCDLAFVVYIGVTISSVLNGLAFLPAVFPTLCIALAVINGVSIIYAILYITLLRK
ncbi:MAG: hypothetical protein J6R44_04830 [Clostridia bacterium]|nr:hypothetical protein [Clostridia bacterium]